MSPDQKKTSILLVEDSPTQAVSLKGALEKSGFHVQLAVDGLEALEKIKKNRSDIIISDIMMPRMNGYEFCKKIKEDPHLKEIPVILWTQLSDTEDVIKGIQSGADSFITKSSETHFIVAAINDAIENRKIPKEFIPGKEIAFFFQGQRFLLRVDPLQITELLLSTYLNAIQKNQELEVANHKLIEKAEDLRRTSEELKKISELKNQFLGMAVHDLRNPLSAIQASSAFLQSNLEEATDSKNLQILNNIYETSSYMIQLINDLLNISDIESGSLKLHLSEVHLDDLIHSDIDQLLPLAKKKNIEIVFQKESDIPSIFCDQFKTSEVIANLITNAIKFSNPGSKITVKLKNVDHQILLTVQDEGIGIAPELMDRLFEPFTKGHVMGTAGEKCTGLGLTIVRKIVEEQQGKIWVESKLGKGSTFFVLLPERVSAKQDQDALLKK